MLSRGVSDAEHDNPYFHTPRAEFELGDCGLSGGTSRGPNRAERITGFARLVAMVGDGHTWMPMHRLPFEWFAARSGFLFLAYSFRAV